MAVYVDDFRAKARVGTITGRWSHLIADSRDELHAFAEQLGLRRSWFQDPVVTGKHPAKPGSRAAENWHYDVTDAKRRQALKLGAKPISWRDLPAVIDRRIAATRLDHACHVIRSSSIGFHNTELAISASRIGRLVATGHLDETTARTALLNAADTLVTATYCNCSIESVTTVINDSFAQAASDTTPASFGIGDAR